MSIDGAYRAGMLAATAAAEERIASLRERLCAVEAERDMLKTWVGNLETALLAIRHGYREENSAAASQRFDGDTKPIVRLREP